jgi:hypothetical protein
MQIQALKNATIIKRRLVETSGGLEYVAEPMALVRGYSYLVDSVTEDSIIFKDGVANDVPNDVYVPLFASASSPGPGCCGGSES